MSEFRFAIIPADAIDDLKLTATDLRVLGVIAYHANRDRSAWPKQKTIAARLKLTREAVNRSLKRLKQRGYVEITPQSRRDGGQRENVYYVPLDPRVNDQRLGARSSDDPQPAPPPCDPTITPPVIAAITPIEHTIGTLTPKPPERGRRAASLEDLDPLIVQAFEIVWAAWPAKGKERSGSRDVCLRAFAKATAKASPAALKIAAAAYGAKTKPQYAVGLNRWLKVGQYENFLPSPQAVKRTEARKLLKVDGRAGECLDAITRRYGEAAAVAWLADASWSETFVILASDWAASQVGERFRDVLQLYGFSAIAKAAA